MDVGEPLSRDRNLRYSRMNLLVYLTPLAFNAGSGQGRDIFREANPDIGP